MMPNLKPTRRAQGLRQIARNALSLYFAPIKGAVAAVRCEVQKIQSELHSISQTSARAGLRHAHVAGRSKFHREK